MDRGQLFGQLGEGHFEPSLLGRSCGVDHQRAPLFGRRARLEFFDDFRDRIVVRRRGHDRQAFIFCVGRDLRLGHQFCEHRQQIVGRFPRERMKTQLGCVGAGRARLQLFESRLDHLLVRRDGQGDQVVRFGVEAQLCIGQQALQQRQRRGRICFGQAIDRELWRVLGRCAVPETFDRLPNQVVFSGGRPDNQVLVVRADRQLGVGHQRL